MISKVVKLSAVDKKVVIFSDTHLSHRSDPAQLKFIERAIGPADRVIINGDFWDYGETTFGEFVNSSWKQLFPLLKKRKAIYLYGNHDLEKACDQRVELFSVKQGDHCLIETTKQQLLVRHGHLLAPSRDVAMPRVFANPPMLKLGNGINLLGVNLALKSYLNLFQIRNRLMKKLSSSFQNNQLLVCGHSHLAEYNLEKKYINNGVIRWGLGQYLKVEDGQLNLVRSRYN